MRSTCSRHCLAWLAAALSGLATGCTGPATVAVPPAALPPAYERTGSPAAQPVLTERWWAGLGDAQLEALVDAALTRSTTIRMAYARLQEARALRAETRATTLPSGGLTGSAIEQGTRREWGSGVTTPGHDSYQLGFTPSWELDLFGRLAAVRGQAQAQFRASTFDFQATRLALAGDVAAALFRARGTAADLATARARLDVSTQLAQSARTGVTRGLTSGQDGARLDADLASARAEVTRLEGELRVAKRSLLILVGTPDAPTDSLAIDPVLAPPPALPPATPGELLARRPDVLSAEQSLLAAGQGARIDRLALFPRFTIQPGVGLSATGGAAGGGTGLWSIAAGLALPILDRPRLLAQFHVSEARGREAAISYETTVQRAFGEAENALTRLAAIRTRLADLEQAEDRSHTAFNLATRGYRAGLTDLTTLLQTESSWLQARSARDAGRLALLTGTVDAIKALGGGWNPHMPENGTPR
ncbi:MAG: TolC family protein [Sphingomonadales bacterium]|nr:TolC family protein [Sphingomonadales bacterium]